MKHLLALLLCCCTPLTTRSEERPWRLDRDFGALFGTLRTPDAGSDTAVLLIAGSGPTDRDGNNPLGVGAATYRLLAEALEEAGFASLRYDKRAIAASRLENPSRVDSLRFEEYIDDAAACAEALRAEGFRRVVLAGHSEGSLIAFAAARRCEADAVVSLSGAGYPMDEVLMTQLAAQLIPARMDLYMEAQRIVARLKQGERVDMTYRPRELYALFNPGVQRFLISQLQYDPRCELRALTIPVLLVSGDNDLQIKPENLDALAEAQPRATRLLIPSMAHTLKCTGERTLAGQLRSVYADPSIPLSQELVEALVDFLREL